ncbi:hypothetical protein V1509DRAFT_269414 [Lipomyces kononenkoae]
MFNRTRGANTARSSPSSTYLSRDLHTSDNLARTTPACDIGNYDDLPEYPWKEISLMPIGDSDRTEYYVWGMDIDYSYPKHVRFKRFKRKLANALAKGIRPPSLSRSSSGRETFVKLLDIEPDYCSEGLKKWPNKTPVVPTTYAVQAAHMSVDEFLQLDEEDGNGTIVECIEEVEDEDMEHLQCTRKWHHRLLKLECKHEKRWKNTQKTDMIEAETDEKSRFFLW